MNELTKKLIPCPYCGETISVLIDSEDINQRYVEDCQVCCKPINFWVFRDIANDLVVNVYSEDEAF